jgi:hypothetical protein
LPPRKEDGGAAGPACRLRRFRHPPRSGQSPGQIGPAPLRRARLRRARLRERR